MSYQHYYLVLGEIIYQDADGAIQARRLNSTAVTKVQKIRAVDLARTQQELQFKLFKQLDAAGLQPQRIQVLDVLIHSISYLGQMTQEEFLKDLSQPEPEPEPDSKGELQSEPETTSE